MVSQKLTTSFDLEANMLSAMRKIGMHPEMLRGCVFLFDPDMSKLRIISVRGLTRKEISRIKIFDSPRIEISQDFPMIFPSGDCVQY